MQQMDADVAEEDEMIEGASLKSYFSGLGDTPCLILGTEGQCFPLFCCIGNTMNFFDNLQV